MGYKNCKTKRKYYKVQEVANMFGISSKTVYGLISEKKLPGLKIGGSVRIPIERFHSWLEIRTIKPLDR